jgi:hypothetical protein
MQGTPWALGCEALILNLWREVKAAPSATRESPVTPEQFTDMLIRIHARMAGHTIDARALPVWQGFMALLAAVTPYECGIGPMPSEGNSPYVVEKP